MNPAMAFALIVLSSLYTAATNNYVRIFSLDVIKNSSGYPNPVRNYSAVATTTTVGDIRCVNGTLDMIYSSSAVGSTAAILRMGKPSVWAVTQAQAATNIADVRIIYAKGDASSTPIPRQAGLRASSAPRAAQAAPWYSKPSA